MFSKRISKEINTKQVDWVNNTRFFALFLVVTYHWFASLRFNTESNIVLMSHFKEALSFLLLQGYQGVILFFFISAFGITLNFDKYKKLRDFYKKRAKAIYPSYFIVVGIAIMLSALSIFKIFELDSGLFFWIRNISLLEFNNNLQGGVWVGYFNPAWWFLFGIIQFYLLFPLLYFVIKRLHLISNVAIIIALTFSCSFISDSVTPIVVMYLPVFYTGILLGMYYKKGTLTFKPNYIIALAAIAAWIVTIHVFNIENGTGLSRLIAPIGLVIFSIFGLNFKTPKIVNAINQYSYEMYLIHNILIIFFPALVIIFMNTSIPLSGWIIGYLLYISLTYVAARNIQTASRVLMEYMNKMLPKAKALITKQ